MRIDPPDIATTREGQAQEWRYAIQIMFATSTPTITSRDGIANLPGSPIEGVIKGISSRSQQVWPDEGRTTIGQITVEIVDINEALTDELRDQLYNDDAGIRDKELRVFAGVGDDFAAFTRVATAFVDSCTYDAGVYTISARDRTRELRDKILDPKTARISAAVSASDTTITVRTTAGFHMVAHGPSFADAPSATVGYLRHKKTGEIMRYTGMTGTTFTGITRGVFRTKAAAIEFNPADPIERWPEVEEYIYIELPGPAMAIALMTGIVNINASPMPRLPDHWHLGMDWSAAFDQASWLNIGTDLWNPADYSEGFPLRLAGFTSDTDGKKLIESDVLRLLGLYAPTTPSGQISLRRVARITATQGYVAELNSDNVVSHGPLRYDLSAVRNKYQVRYNYDGEEFTRSMAVVDAGSIARNGESETSTLEFRSLTTERHTERLIRARLEAMGDRYADPPIRLQTRCTPNMTWLEIGDTVRVRLSSVQNHVSIGTGTLDQTFEVQSTTINWTTGEVTLELFASGRLIERGGTNELPDSVLADSWYTSTGTNISGLTGYVAGSPARLTADVTLTGTSDINDAGSIWYHAGDLQIDAGVTVTIQNQAQLRVRGFFTNAGTIDGAGRGHPGGTDPDTVGATSTGWAKATGIAGYLGPTRPGAGMLFFYSDGNEVEHYRQIDAAVIEGKARATAAPYLSLATDNAGALTTSLPADLRGTSGSPGASVINRVGNFTSPLGSGGTLSRKGGAGGASGAGLAIICRGLGFSTSGEITLAGAAGQPGQIGGTPDIYDVNKKIHWDLAEQAGAGAGGFPGSLHILLDGDGVPYPDINATTIDLTVGTTPIQGYSAIRADNVRFRSGSNYYTWPSLRWGTDLPGDGDSISPRPSFTGMNSSLPLAGNLWAAASMIQYIPATGEGTPDAVPAPVDLNLTVNTGSITASWQRNAGWDFVEVFAATSNDRAYAVEVGEAAASAFTHQLPDGGLRYYWIRAVRGTGAQRQVSAFYPSGATSGVSATAPPSGITTTLTASNGMTWNGDTTTSPTTWTPSSPTTDLTFTVFQFGSQIAQEVVRVTLDTSTGALTWAYITNDAGVTTTASSTPASVITFTFVHVTSGLTTLASVTAVRGGGGAAGPPGADGADGADGVDGVDGVDGAPGAPASRILSVRNNRNDMSTTVVNGSMYVHGFDSLGNPIAGPGEIGFNGTTAVVPNGAIATSQNLTEGWLLLETNTGSTPFSGARIGAARKSRAGWVYDNGTAWTAFTATATMVAFGAYSRVAGVIVGAAVIGNALALGAVPYENAHQVQAGDIQSGAISDLDAFTSTMRPTAVLSSLPGLPAAAYPNGALIYLTSDKKVYRADYARSPIAWTAAVDGADIVAGTVTAAALAADIVLATLFRTAGSGNRVELEGNGHDFPFWIGSGTKGSTSGAPGSGAKVYYDEPADEFVVTGRLEASVVGWDADEAFMAETESGKKAALAIALSATGVNNVSTAYDGSYHTLITLPTIFHPSYAAGGTIAGRRLQAADQPFLLTWFIHAANWASGANTPSFRFYYKYDGGTATVYDTTNFTSLDDGESDVRFLTLHRKAKATGWSQTLQIACECIGSSSAGNAYLRGIGMIALPNMGAAGIVAAELT
jgi:hypothetical protein